MRLLFQWKNTGFVVTNICAPVLFNIGFEQKDLATLCAKVYLVKLLFVRHSWLLSIIVTIYGEY